MIYNYHYQSKICGNPFPRLNYLEPPARTRSSVDHRFSCKCKKKRSCNNCTVAAFTLCVPRQLSRHSASIKICAAENRFEISKQNEIKVKNKTEQINAIATLNLSTVLIQRMIVCDECFNDQLIVKKSETNLTLSRTACSKAHNLYPWWIIEQEIHMDRYTC